MAEIKKAVDWQGENLNIYKQVDRKDISPDSIEHIWAPNGVQQIGTVVDAEYLNNMSKNNVYGILETTKEIVSGVERYRVNNFAGIEEFGVFEGLKLKLRMSEANTKDSPKLYINEQEYSLICFSNNAYIDIKTGQFEEKQIYDLVFNGVEFIVSNSSLKSTENTRGITSGLDMRETEAAYTLGTQYGDVFGSALTSIEAGKTYYYFDSANNIYVPYKALVTTTKTGGFITPDLINFQNISNDEIVKKGSRNLSIVSNGTAINIAPGQSQTFNYNFTTYGINYENITSARLTIQTYINVYMNNLIPIECHRNDISNYRNYTKNFDASNDACYYEINFSLQGTGTSVTFRNYSTTKTISFFINQLSYFF